ncbi:hypothetical protein BDY17DRAFT_302825 [Neohortaea acidophila]|uniref:K Homology domain-containing protein n=1 Tax=Neohortaea acidophila TaxID=245834 RepID=A0A6A6PIW8_9PEZI|nr:uncharacterized protein BDY17DRAFT_302825 [Neohortaea acidophila]KAF2479865.1 hypothetical protein BDY17DRAFT_302825 [Neohortaea acidophila]
MSDDRRKRSRFDQTEAEAARPSRFDRRSRSPKREDAEPRRSRSPVQQDEGRRSSDARRQAAAAAAAAAAAKINEQLNLKKASQRVDVPPIRSTQSPANAGATQSPDSSATLTAEVYQQDGDFIRDIEVNDLRNRYTMTKGATQKMIKEKTGADVTTRGEYYPDKSMATPANPPLYLHITSTTKDGLEKAVKEIEELMKQDLPNLIDERRFRRNREPEQQQVERDSMGRRKWPEERIPIDLEPIPGFNLRAQVVGAGGSYVKHIQQETGCRVQIKGRGSGFYEHDTGVESDEQMYLHVAGPDPNQVEVAKQQCIDLLDTVKGNYQEFKERGPRGGSGGGRGGGYDDRRGGGYEQRERNNGSGTYGGNGQAYNYQQPQQAAYGGVAQSPPAALQQPDQQAQAANMDPAVLAAWVQYYQEHPDQDPYAAYGGYAAMMAQYYQAQPQQPQYPGYAGSPVQQQYPGYAGQNGAAPPPPPPPGV